MANQITGFACINIPVSNVEASVEFYVNKLGCKLLREVQRGEHVTNAFIQFGDTGPAAILHEEEVKYELHYKRHDHYVPLFELECSDVQSFFEQLKKQSVRLEGEVGTHTCGDRFQVVDPDQNRLLLIQK
ncbi:VOC family protein [Evansella halocellulosilytica]|uniref:VOC family protein n=1 Tax=Evansella halocellulosilytica TaxID=2011013 RepID=UPI000BB94FF5|nr:VOC family protein [Evansella halocellulosilytica]